MKNINFCFTLVVFLFVNQLIAQETFEAKVKAIAHEIENISKEEKAALEIEIEAVDDDLEKGLITKEQADEKKREITEIHSKNYEARISQAQTELKEIVRQKAEGKIKDEKSSDSIIIKFGDKPIIKIEKDTLIYKRIIYYGKRTNTQFLFAFGLNNLITNESPANSDFKYWGSHFYEWGLSFKTRLLKNDNLLHLRYGMSLMYNNLRPTDNRVFVKNGAQTDLETFPTELNDSRFRNVYFTTPLHLEFNFSKEGYRFGKNKINTGVRFGLGGYAGLRVKSKQKIYYEIEDKKVREKEKGNFNVNDFIYGVSTYLGYKATSLYLKYDLNPLFESNEIKQNNVSLGLRFDIP